MELLFVHSSKMKEDERKNLYTSGSYNQKVWDRYLSICDHLSVMLEKEKKIYSEDFASRNFQYFDKENMNYIALPNLRTSILAYVNIFKRYRRYETIKKAVKKSDAIIVRLPSGPGNIAIKYAKKYNKPYLIEVVGCPWDAYWNHSWKGKIFAPYMWYRTRELIENAPFTLYVSERFLQNRYPCGGETISCSDVELLNLDEKILKKRLNKIESISDDKPIVIGTTAAVNVRYKGQEHVIKAISKLKEQGYNFEYNIVGGGDSTYLESICNKYGISDKVKFLGPLPHNKIFDFLDEVDIYVQPSKLEGLPRALVEALSRGCPSIGSMAGGIPELLNNDFMFHTGDVNEICNLLKKLDKETMINEAKRSFEKAKEYDKRLLDKKRNVFYSSFKGNN